MIIDNFLTDEDWLQCLDYFKGSYWTYPPLSGQTNKTCVWRIFDPTVESTVGGILYRQLAKLDIGPFAVQRVGINGATTFNESHCHVDGPPGNYSLIWFASESWDTSWAGQLQIFNDESCWQTFDITKKPDTSLGLTEIEYIPNRAVLFPSHLAHMPVTPNIRAKNNLRLSVGLHLTPSDSWNYRYIPRT